VYIYVVYRRQLLKILIWAIDGRYTEHPFNIMRLMFNAILSALNNCSRLYVNYYFILLTRDRHFPGRQTMKPSSVTFLRNDQCSSKLQPINQLCLHQSDDAFKKVGVAVGSSLICATSDGKIL
jgi:hypothetical protein